MPCPAIIDLVAVKGPAARALLHALLDAVSELVPDDVDIEVTGDGRYCDLLASRSVPPSQISQENPFGGAMSDTSATLGPGPWAIPARMVAAKLTVQDALEAIQQTITGAVRSPWPGPDYTVRVDAQDSCVRTWFDNGKQQIEVATIDYRLATG